ncbi:sugar ABC transporter permease [Acrocarpospora macrocephala]|uniref:Sugar ABC transporter permease n=1 Tax=Acrocarpospora macrocephala TaxID=150177 RepID=A0A5M3X772_9ACTN|nr:sugar ABC transporter permease [Acrocarpospora macrocephala]GES16522.1 sugar ABC transporter permease [Acrocarpospora macrocephala]
MTLTAQENRRAGAPQRARPPRRSLRLDRFGLPSLLLAPLLAVVVGVVGYPIVRTIWLSFHEGEYLISGPFNGLDNYTALFADPYFVAALIRTTLFAVVCVCCTLLISLAVALVLDVGSWLTRIVTVIVLLPWAMPRVASGIVWKWIFNDQYGIANWLLVSLGFDQFQGYAWFNSGFSSLVAITIAVVWHSVPFIAISMLAGLRATRGEVLEAARVDGANFMQLLLRIRLPMMKPLLTILGVMSTIFAYQSFDHFLVMTTPPGGPSHSTEVLSLLTWLQAFTVLDQGAAAAMAVVTFVLLAGITAVYVRLSKEDK